MNFYQIIVVVFGSIVAFISIAGVVTVARSDKFHLKPLWIVGCLLGFLGLGINWTSPDDLVLLFGVSIPVISIFKLLPAGPIVVKTFFPFIAATALIRDRASPS